MTLLSNLRSRTTAEPEPEVGVAYTAACPGCGVDVTWRSIPSAASSVTYSRPDECACSSETCERTDRITGTGTEEPRRSDDSPASESATGLPDPQAA